MISFPGMVRSRLRASSCSSQPFRSAVQYSCSRQNAVRDAEVATREESIGPAMSSVVKYLKKHKKLTKMLPNPPKTSTKNKNVQNI